MLWHVQDFAWNNLNECYWLNKKKNLFHCLFIYFLHSLFCFFTHIIFLSLIFLFTFSFLWLSFSSPFSLPILFFFVSFSFSFPPPFLSLPLSPHREVRRTSDPQDMPSRLTIRTGKKPREIKDNFLDKTNRYKNSVKKYEI